MKRKKTNERRPYLASQCHSLEEGEKWRHQILREIGKHVAEIQNSGLGEHKIRDVNDQINKLIREKAHWEKRIRELGGPDYAKTAPKILDSDGKEVKGSGGYLYFGAAKDLPGVKELFQKDDGPSKDKKTRYELCKNIDADYYGFRDEDDGVLELLEREYEKKAIAKSVQQWKESSQEREKAGSTVKNKSYQAAALLITESNNDDEYMHDINDEMDENEGFKVHVPLPSQSDMEKRVVEKRKEELLKRYVSEDLKAEEQEAKKLLNIKKKEAV